MSPLPPSPSNDVFVCLVRHPKPLHGAASLLPETSQSSVGWHPLCLSNVPAILGNEASANSWEVEIIHLAHHIGGFEH